jgi:hypothetical protein
MLTRVPYTESGQIKRLLCHVTQEISKFSKDIITFSFYLGKKVRYKKMYQESHEKAS